MTSSVDDIMVTDSIAHVQTAVSRRPTQVCPCTVLLFVPICALIFKTI